MPTDPYWAHNLRAHPEAHVIVDRREHRVRAHLAQHEERARLWTEIVARAPVYGHYQERAKAHREIPVFVLERADGGALEAP
jgi:deazaflavin-dependent oxidoreductase (nitroreductase family)